MKKKIWITLGAVLAALVILGGVCLLLWPEPGEPIALPQYTIHAAGHARATERWLEVSGKQYYRLSDGTLATGFTDIDDKRYYFQEDHSLYAGWLALDGDRYYIKEDGTMAKGQVNLSGENHFFTSAGKEVLLVNRQNPVPDSYETEMVKLESVEISITALEALKALVAAGRAAGHPCSLASGYRSYSLQKYIWDRNMNDYMRQGCSYNTAYALTAESVMNPGHSEHQTGLAIDFNSTQTGSINWLQEHCWEYGFILRYPPDTKDKTGIIYEPWHYRYVGVELAMELKELGLCMEEYMEMLTEQDQ